MSSDVPSGPALTTERLVLRDWTTDEVDRAFDLYSRWEVMRWLGADPQPLEERDRARAMVERWAAVNAAEPVGGLWAAERRDTGVVTGTVLLVPLPDGDGEYEVGWHLHPDSWGHGFATEAARGVLDRAWERGLAEVFAVVRPDNDRSTAVCARLGMEDLGTTDRYYGATLRFFRAIP